MMDIEITCEIFETTEKIKNTLLENGFQFIESFTLDDIYMYCKNNNKKTYRKYANRYGKF